ncbi:HalOD1 output domain-containing protein [Halobellus captivus]|uniref:HalOD1 output domain-containing protein n=1 Tax=Halobellus captivus TaxID=2592614 RepID=UPI00193AAE08|nr:HalOD1 output domain-containing protein [Halobellus captivus]
MSPNSEYHPISLQIIDTVAAAKGVSPMELTPLADVIDPDALDSLYSPATATTVTLRFEYEGYSVRIDDDGSVTLSESDAPTR